MTKLTKSLLLVFALFALPSAVLAQTASPSGSIRDNVKQQVEAELADIKKGVAKKAFVGTITTKDSNIFTITTLKNQTRTATVSTDTTIKLASNKDGTIADVKVNDFGIFMGEVDSKNTMTIKRLLILPTPPTDKRQIVYATVTKSQPNSLTVETLKKESLTIKITSTTKYTGTTKYADVKVASKILLTAKPDSSNTLSATLIHLIN